MTEGVNIMPARVLNPELLMGTVSYVSPHTARVNLMHAGAPSGSHYLGARYGMGEVGEFVLIEGQTSLLVGRIVEVRVPESERRMIGSRDIASNQLDALATVELLGCIAMDSLTVKIGIDQYPRLGDRVYSAPHSVLSKIPSMTSETDDRVTLSIGSVDVAEDSEVKITPEKLFGRHCAILGTTGAGKSWTTARIIEECLKHNAKIVLLDATGEYCGFSGRYVMHCSLGSPGDTKRSIQCSLPPSSFTESDFIAMFEPSGKVQGPKLRAAIRSLRLARLRPDLAVEGLIRKIEQPREPIEKAERELGDKLDDPRQPFDVKFLVSQIEQECVWPTARNDSTKWGSEDGNFAYCLALVSRINAILTSPAFRCVFKPSEDSLPLDEAINAFLNGSKRLLRICVSGIPHEYKAREIIANAIGRNLLNRARNGDFEKKPIVVVVDEAHNFLGRNIGSEDYVHRLDAFELIAKEGRKYRLNICLATQRPRDITEDVLSQMGTLVVHRLINDRDREVVERACGEIDRAAASFLPSLKPGEAAIIGVDFPIPLTIQVLKPSTPPRSAGPDYQKTWKTIVQP